jgi:Ca2+:H+ antiporter
MDAAISIAVGSSIQIAVFVLPITVLAGWAMGQPFTLNFDPFAVIIMTLSVILAYFVMADGRSNWFLGLQLLLTYAFISTVFFLAHDAPQSSSSPTSDRWP